MTAPTAHDHAGGADLEPVRAEPAPWRRRTVLRQTWAELASFHWPYDPGLVDRWLPDGVSVDTFDGQAWVGLIPFEMQRVQLGRSPAVPYLGDFIEINVRTYVVDERGRRAVWFGSLAWAAFEVVSPSPAAISLATASLARMSKVFQST